MNAPAAPDPKAFAAAAAASLPPWVLVAAAVALPLAIAAFAFLKKKRDEKAAAPAVVVAPASEELKPGHLVGVWRRFLRKQPSNVRRSIYHFEPVLVLGAAGSGKSRMIDHASDWRRAERQFLESESNDSEMQVYFGSNELTFEFSGKVSLGTSRACRESLTRLLAPIVRRREPLVVVAIDGSKLAKQLPDAIETTAETLRGKLTLVSTLARKPVLARVVVTHLDEIEGFDAFVRFCVAQGLPTALPVRAPKKGVTTGDELATALASYEDHLPRALTTLSASDYRKLIVFLSEMPKWLPSLQQLCDVMFAHDGLTIGVMPDGLYFASDHREATNPLRRNVALGAGPDPHAQHRTFALAAAAVGVVYLSSGWALQRQGWAGADRALAAYHASSSRETAYRDAIASFTSRDTSRWHFFHPRFFESARLRMRAQFSQQVRDEYVIPRIKRVESGKDPFREALMLLALAHSDKTDPLHVLRADRLARWSKVLGLNADILKDYIENVDERFVATLDFPIGANTDKRVSEVERWASLARSLARAQQESDITLDELEEMHHTARYLRVTLKDDGENEDAAEILEWLEGRRRDDVSSVGFETTKKGYVQRFGSFADLVRDREGLKRVIEAVERAEVAVAQPPVLLADLSMRMRAECVDPDPESVRGGGVLRFDFGGTDLKFDTSVWEATMHASRVRELVRAFHEVHSSGEYAGSSIFFTSEIERSLSAVQWNRFGDNGAIFTGSGQIEGRTTRPAFSEFVKKPIAQFAKSVGCVKISPFEKQQLVRYVADRTDEYAEEVRKQLALFWNEFGLRATSAEALRVALTQMTKQTSPFSEFLDAVRTNAAIAQDANVDMLAKDPSLGGMSEAEATSVATMLQPVRDRLHEFDAIQNMFQGAAGATEIDKYKTILDQLAKDLSGSDAPDSQLARVTSMRVGPQGRLALVVLQGGAGSYLRLVDDWLTSVRVPQSLSMPFLLPVVELYKVGAVDLQRAFETSRCEFAREPGIEALSRRFPFADPQLVAARAKEQGLETPAVEDASPQDLAQLFHPANGHMANFFRVNVDPFATAKAARYLDADECYVSDGMPQNLFKRRCDLRMPREIVSMRDDVAHLASMLWDVAGNPVSMPLTVEPMPVVRSVEGNEAPTLLYATLADANVYFFNQQPTRTTVSFDWTKRTMSQVGVQLTDLTSRVNLYPEPVVSQGYWSALRLLQASVDPREKKAPGREQTFVKYTWDIRNSQDDERVSRASLKVYGDPWRIRTLGQSVLERMRRQAAQCRDAQFAANP